MPLPKISHRILKTTLPSDGREVRFRPMQGREEKLLLIAKEGDDHDEILSTIKQVVNNCVLDDDVDVNELPVYDVEWLFIQVRIESVSPIAQVSYIDHSDEKRYDFEVDLRKVVVEKKEDPGNVIKLTDDVSVELRRPSADAFIRAVGSEVDTDGEVAHEVAVSCLYRIFDGDETAMASSFSRQELDEFVNSFDLDSYRSLMEWVSSTPSLRYVISYTNSKGEEREVVLSNLTDFFKFR